MHLKNIFHTQDTIKSWNDNAILKKKNGISLPSHPKVSASGSAQLSPEDEDTPDSSTEDERDSPATGEYNRSLR